MLDRVELSFNVDESTAHKHLVAKFDFDKNKSDAYTYDLKQQQYQNVYFTLPIFVLIVGLLLNSKKVQQRLVVFRNGVQQSGGVVNYLQSLLQSKSQPVVTEQPSKPSKATNKFAQKHQQASRDSDSEVSKAKSVLGRSSLAGNSSSTAPSTPTMAVPKVFNEPAVMISSAQLSKNDRSDEGSLEESDSVEGDYAIVKNPATTKRKVKKIN